MATSPRRRVPAVPKPPVRIETQVKTTRAAQVFPTETGTPGPYREMLLIRRFEEKAGQLYGMGFIGGFRPSGIIGQEAVASACRCR